DPAKRLADALGLDAAGLTGDPVRIALDEIAGVDGSDDGGSGGGGRGELWAMMLDTKSTFDALVAKHAADPAQAERILANTFYRNISEALSGTQEYMAMEKLYELHEDADYDLVVVDTPPTRHALDFLDAPRRLSHFLDHRLFRMLVAPRSGLVRAVNVAAQTFLRSVSRVVGGDVIDDAIAFFQAFEGMEEGFRERADRVNELLSDRATAFLLVASARRDTLQEARFFADRLHEAGIPVEGLIVNRVHPPFGDGLAEATRSRAATLAGTALGDLYANLADFQAVAAREREHLAGLEGAVASAPVVWVPFLGQDVHDLEGMAEVARLLFPTDAAA
ncbi:MAG TPA: ArsA-related P-loop ATPase, partial [Acidimicrobiales bacterium]